MSGFTKTNNTRVNQVYFEGYEKLVRIAYLQFLLLLKENFT